MMWRILTFGNSRSPLTPWALVIQSGALTFLFLAFVVASRLFNWGFPQRRTVNPLYAVLNPVAPNLFTLLAIAVFAVFLFLIWYLLRRARPHLFAALLVFAVSSFALNLSVAMVRGGPEALEDPFLRPEEYYAEVGKINDVGSFVANYPALTASFVSIHGRVHPPGPILLLWAVSRLIGPGPLIASVAVILIGSLSVVPVYLLLSELYDQRTAVIGGALYVLTPSIMMFTATSMNAVFTFPASWSFYLAVKLIRSKIRAGYALGLGAVLSLSAFFTFDQVFVVFFLGVAVIAFVALGRRWSRLATAFLIPAVFVMAYGLLYLLTGYNLVDVFRVTYAYYQQDVAKMVDLYGSQSVSTLYWIVGNPVAFLMFLGIPVTVLLGRGAVVMFRDSRSDTAKSAISFAALGTLLAVNVPGLYKGEVERIWMYLVPLAIVIAVRALPRQSVQSSAVLPVGGVSLVSHSEWSGETGPVCESAGGLTSGICFILAALGAQTLLFEHVLYTFW